MLVTLRGHAVDPQNLTQWLSARAREVGVRCSPHRLRHTAATLMLNEVGSISTVSSFLGHTETRTTSVYARVLDETSEAATEALGNVVDRLYDESPGACGSVRIGTATSNSIRVQ